LRRGPDGVLRYTTRSGMLHLVEPEGQPICDDGRAGRLWEALLETQPSTAELVQALEAIGLHRRIVEDSHHRAEMVAQSETGYWDVPPAEPELAEMSGPAFGSRRATHST
jgi:hypothetical protein